MQRSKPAIISSVFTIRKKPPYLWGAEPSRQRLLWVSFWIETQQPFSTSGPQQALVGGNEYQFITHIAKGYCEVQRGA